MPMSPDEREKWGELNARVNHLDKAVDDLRAGQRQRRADQLLWSVTWVQVIAVTAAGAVVTIGGGLLVAWLAHKWF